MPHAGHSDDSERVAARRPAAHERARAAVEHALRPTYGVRLCVVVSRYSTDELAAVDRDVEVLWREPERHGMLSIGQTVGDDLQRQVELSVVRMTDELHGAMDRHPPGLLRVDPWLVRAPER